MSPNSGSKPAGSASAPGVPATTDEAFVQDDTAPRAGTLDGGAAPAPKRSRTKAGTDSGPAAGAAAGAATATAPARTAAKPGPDGLDSMRLTGDRLMVRIPEDRERMSKAGLLIPATAASTHRRCVWSCVVLVGPESRGLRPGDLVLFMLQSGLEVEVDGETFLLLRERDVQAVASERVDRHAGQYL